MGIFSFVKEKANSPLTRFRFSAFALLLLLVLYLTNDFALLSIRQSALVVAVGIDAAEDGGVEVSLQIAVPEADDTAQKSHQETVSAKAGTVSAAIRLCGQACGWYPVTAFCSLIILGEETVQNNVMETLDFFIQDAKVEDAAKVAACQGKAKDIINSATPLDGVSSFAFEKIFSVNKTTISTVNPITVKEFAEGCFSQGETAYMPYIRKVPIEEKSISFREQPLPPKGVLYLPSYGSIPAENLSQGQNNGNENGGGSSGGESGSSGGSGGNASGGASASKGESQTVGLYDASATLLFFKGKAVGLLDAPQSLTKSTLLLSGSQGILPVYNVPENGKSVSYLLNVVKNESSAKLTLKNGLPHLKIRMHLTAKTEDGGSFTDVQNAGRKGFLSPTVKKVAEGQIRTYFEQMITLCKESGCDAFGLHLQLYRKHPKHYQRLKDRLFSELTVSYDIQVKELK
ncbi:MAG: hypothetical protein IKC56_04495 [Clostridia bacterium]|nr:hypothetical protein [Clostridia bacterium]